MSAPDPQEELRRQVREFVARLKAELPEPQQPQPLFRPGSPMARTIARLI